MASTTKRNLTNGDTCIIVNKKAFLGASGGLSNQFPTTFPHS